MPKRVIDFDALWGSDKIASCAEWAQAEYAWLYGLADPSGCFELTNLRVIWGRVAAVRRNLTIERLEQIFGEFQDKGLLFVWGHEGKVYGHWTGSDVPGRLPPPSWRMRLERLAPPVPKQQLAEYMSRFARGRAASPGGGFFVGTRADDESLKCESSNLKDGANGVPAKVLNGKLEEGLKGGVEAVQGQDLGLDLGGNGKEVLDAGHLRAEMDQPLKQNEGFYQTALFASNSTPNSESKSKVPLGENPKAGSHAIANECAAANAHFVARANSSGIAAANADVRVQGSASAAARPFSPNVPRDKWDQAARELRVGQGPSCGPVCVKPEALERIRLRNSGRGGSQSP